MTPSHADAKASCAKIQYVTPPPPPTSAGGHHKVINHELFHPIQILYNETGHHYMKFGPMICYPHAFLKKRRGYCNRLRPSVRPSVCPSVCPSVRPSVTLSPPKPLDEIQPNLVCGLLT